jgi:lipopolysaccharide/colanic/teichoic acid biosynthesis glycosyltransferase
VRAGKRAVDVVGAVTLLLVLLPFLVMICVLILVLHGGPVLFAQERPGLNGKIFRMYKFCTMSDERDEFGQLLPDVERITRFGRFLRALSLDELPQLLVVLKGDMSLVGPRPLLVRYMPVYELGQTERARIKPGMAGWDQIKRHQVKPGMTGWAQINGRNGVGYEKRFELDGWYVDNWSLWVDIKILCLTPFKMLKRSGIAPVGHAPVGEAVVEFAGFGIFDEGTKRIEDACPPANGRVRICC